MRRSRRQKATITSLSARRTPGCAGARRRRGSWIQTLASVAGQASARNRSGPGDEEMRYAGLHRLAQAGTAILKDMMARVIHTRYAGCDGLIFLPPRQGRQNRPRCPSSWDWAPFRVPVPVAADGPGRGPDAGPALTARRATAPGRAICGTSSSTATRYLGYSTLSRCPDSATPSSRG